MIEEFITKIREELEQKGREGYVGNISFQVNFGVAGLSNMNITTNKSWKSSIKKEIKV